MTTDPQLQRPRLARRRLLRVLGGAAALGLGRFAHADELPLEARIKAAYIYKFLSFVEWPAAAFADAGSPIVIGVAGAPEVLAELQRVLPGRTVHGRPLQARALPPGGAVDALHVLFAGGKLAGSDWVAGLQGRPLLLVTDAPQGLEAGSAINFVLVGGRVRFEVSLPAVERAGLRLSSRMLGVAERVVGAR